MNGFLVTIILGFVVLAGLESGAPGILNRAMALSIVVSDNADLPARLRLAIEAAALSAANKP